MCQNDTQEQGYDSPLFLLAEEMLYLRKRKEMTEMKWKEMKRNEMKRNEKKRNEKKWNEKKRNVVFILNVVFY